MSRSFLEELKKRRVYRVAIGYILVGSAMVQVAGTVLPTFHAPEWTQQVFVIFVALGFPIGLVLAWGFDLQGGSIKRARGPRGRHASVNARRVWILGAFGAAIALLVLTAYWLWHPWKRGMDAAPGSVSSRIPPAPAPAKSIAVLPFENLTDDKQNSYFIDGVQEEILVNLGKVSGLKVISRTSVKQYDGDLPRNLRDIAKTLGVTHVLEGSVQRESGRIRVTAQLINARDDTNVWAERYDRELADIFALQSELAEQIVAQLQIRLSPEEKAAIEERPTADLTAYDHYVRAKALIATTSFSDRAKDNLLESVRLLEQAVARDPKFFLAYCQLAGAHDRLYFFGIDHTPGRLAQADAAIKMAVQLKPRAGEAHLATAAHFYYGYLNYERARQELAIAVRALPNEPFIFALSGYIDRRQGRWDESARDFERALELDPRNFYTLQQLSFTYRKLRRFREMAATLERALKLEPTDLTTRVRRAGVELDWRADPRPLRAIIQTIVSESPSAIGEVAQTWHYLALCERNATDAQQALAAMNSDGCRDQGIPFPRSWCEGVAARTFEGSDAGRAAFTSARVEVEKMLQEQPGYAEALCVLGLIDAALGRKDQALEEGRRAVQLLPLAKDSINGGRLMEYLAVIYAWTGEKDLALAQLESVSRIPGEICYGDLRLHPAWDPLRGDPRFEKVVAGFAPQ